MIVSGFLPFSVLALSLVAADLPTDPPVIDGAVPLEEPGRYRSMRSYDKTLDYYRRLFRSTGGVQWRTIVNLPSIKARHVRSLRQKTRWEGLNIYEKNGETRIYFVMRKPAAQSPPKSSR